MHYRHPQNRTIFNRVNDAVRESVQATTAELFVKRLPDLRPLNNSLNCLAKLPEKVTAQGGNTALLIPGRLPQFVFGPAAAAGISFQFRFNGSKRLVAIERVEFARAKCP